MPAPRRLGAIPSQCELLLFSPDGRKLVAICQPLDEEAKQEKKSYLVFVIDAGTGKELRRFETRRPIRQGQTTALSTRYLAFGLEDEEGTVLLWDLAEVQDKQLKTGHRRHYSAKGVSALAFSHDGAMLVTGGRDSEVKVWDTARLTEIRAIKNAHSGWIESLAISRDGRRLACSGQREIIQHWDLTTGRSLDADLGSRDWVWGVKYSPDDATAITVSSDGRLSFWDFATGKVKRAITIPAITRYRPHLALSPDGKTALVSVAEKLLNFDAVSGDELTLPKTLTDLRVEHVYCGTDGKNLVTVHSAEVSMVDWPSGRVRRRFEIPEPKTKPAETRFKAAALSADGQWLVTLTDRYWTQKDGTRGGDSILDLWDTASGKHVRRIRDNGGGYLALFSAKGELLFGGWGGTLRNGTGKHDVALDFQRFELHLVDPIIGRLIRAFEKSPAENGQGSRYSQAIEFSPDGRSIYSGGNDGVVHIYETATGKIRRSLRGHRGFIASLAVSSDGQRLLTGSQDLTALVWDVSLPRIRRHGKTPPTPAEQANLWEQLAELDAKIAYQAMAEYVANPKMAIAAIRDGVKPAPATAADATLDRIVAELGSEKFLVRSRAAGQLDELGESAVAGMRSRLKNGLLLETARRIESLLGKYDPELMPPIVLRQIRAVEILESLNDPESHQLLSAFANGARDARLTHDAAESLARCKRAPRK